MAAPCALISVISAITCVISALKLGERGPGLDALLVHINRPVDLDLHDVLIALWASVMLGNKGACERRVARHAQAGACERRLDPVNYLVACCGAIAVTQHNFGLRAIPRV